MKRAMRKSLSMMIIIAMIFTLMVPAMVFAEGDEPVVVSINVSGATNITILPADQTTETYTAEVIDQFDAVMGGENVIWSLQEAVMGVTIDETTGVVTVQDAYSASAGTFTVVATSVSEGSVIGALEVTLETAPTYSVTIADVVGGTATVTVDKATAEAGATVTITIDSIQDGKQIASVMLSVGALEEYGFGYSFVMPAEAVTVTVILENSGCKVINISIANTLLVGRHAFNLSDPN